MTPGADPPTRWRRRTKRSTRPKSPPSPEDPMMSLFAMTFIGDLFYALPLVVAVSLVYAATRHEKMDHILRHAARVAGWILGFMAVVFVVLALVSYRVSA